MDFVAVDVETADPDLSSICQIAVVDFKGGAVSGSWQSFVDPSDYFDPRNTAIHGISEAAVRGAPTIAGLASELQSRLAGALVASHTPFDRVAIFRALEKHRVPLIESRWLDTARVVRRAWPQFARSGYGLANVARHLGVVFQHHVAEEDARVAGEILLRAIAETGVNIEGWLHRSTEPVGGSIAREGSEGVPPFGDDALQILIAGGSEQIVTGDQRASPSVDIRQRTEAVPLWLEDEVLVTERLIGCRRGIYRHRPTSWCFSSS